MFILALFILVSAAQRYVVMHTCEPSYSFTGSLDGGCPRESMDSDTILPLSDYYDTLEKALAYMIIFKDPTLFKLEPVEVELVKTTTTKAKRCVEQEYDKDVFAYKLK